MKKLLTLLSIITISGLTSCQSNIPTNNQALKTNNISVSSKNNIKGIVQFPKINFKVKALVSEISPESTVSISYLPSVPIVGSRVIASGLTDINGSFAINTYSDFNPVNGDIYVLEVSNRLHGAGNQLLSLRTFIKWENNNWNSMTGTGIFINSYTTALALIAHNENILAGDTIGKIAVSQTNIVPSDIGTAPDIKVTADTINKISAMVTDAVLENKDPFSAIISDGFSYHIDRTFEVGKLKETNACTACSFVGQELPDILANTNLTTANLAEQDLTFNNLTNTTLTGANLTDSILSEMDLRVIHNKDLNNVNFTNALADGVDFSGTSTIAGANLSNADFTNADLSYSLLQYTNLSSAHFNHADMSYSDLTGATINQTDFSYAKLSGYDFTSVNNKSMVGCTFNFTPMDGANFSGDATNAGVDLTNSDLSNAILTNSSLQYTNLSGVHFNSANLSYADLNGATNITTTDFSGANMSFATWTDGTTFGDNSICAANSIGVCTVIGQ